MAAKCKRAHTHARTHMHAQVWSSSGYLPLGQHIGHTDAVTCLALDANFLFSGSDDCTIRLWDAVPATPAANAALASPSSPTGAKGE